MRWSCLHETRVSREEASAGTLAEGQLDHYAAQQPALRASWGEQETRQGGLARQSGSLHLHSATPWGIHKRWGQGPHAQLIRIPSPPPPGTSGQLPDVLGPQLSTGEGGLNQVSVFTQCGVSELSLRPCILSGHVILDESTHLPRLSIPRWQPEVGHIILGRT